MKKGYKLILLVTIAIFAIIIAVILINFPSITGFVSSEDNNKSINFKIGTFAICNDKDNFKYCQDKIFASCNGTLIEVNSNEIECLGRKYSISNLALGETYLIQNWSDPRQKDFLTAWAISE